MTWQMLKHNLRQEYDRLKEEKEHLLRSTDENDIQYNGSYFQINAGPIGPYIKRIFFNWKNYLGIDGTYCHHAMNDMYTALALYDVSIIMVFPMPKEMFRAYHPFSTDEFGRIKQLCRDGRVILWLSDLDGFDGHLYLQELLDGSRLAYVPWNLDGHISEKAAEAIIEHDRVTEELVSKPHVHQEIVSRAGEASERVKTTELAVLTPLQDLMHYGFPDLQAAAIDIMDKDPRQGIIFTDFLRRVIINPIRFGLGATHAWSRDRLTFEIGNSLNLRNERLVFPEDITGLLQQKLALPTPNSWDSLSWMEDNIDLPLIRKSVASIESEMLQAQPSADVRSESMDRLREIWDSQVSRVDKSRTVAVWSSTLALGAAGAIAAGPITAMALGVGLSAVSNLIAEPLSQRVAKLSAPSAIHTWQLSKRGLPSKLR